MANNSSPKRWALVQLTCVNQVATDGGYTRQDLYLDGIIFRPANGVDHEELARATGAALAVRLETHDAMLLVPLSVVSFLASEQVYSDLWNAKPSSVQAEPVLQLFQHLAIVARGRLSPLSDVSPLASHSQDMRLDQVIACLQRAGYVHTPIPSSYDRTVLRLGYWDFSTTPLHILINRAARIAESLASDALTNGTPSSKLLPTPYEAARRLQGLQEASKRFASGCGQCLLRRRRPDHDYGYESLIPEPTTPATGPDSLCHLASLAARCQGRHPLRGWISNDDRSPQWIMNIDQWTLDVKNWVQRVRKVDPSFAEWAALSYRAAALQWEVNGISYRSAGLDREVTASPDGMKFRPLGILALLPGRQDLALALGRANSTWALGLMGPAYTTRVHQALQWRASLTPSDSGQDSLENASPASLRTLLFWYAVADVLELYGVVSQWLSVLSSQRRQAYIIHPKDFVKQLFAAIGRPVPERFPLPTPIGGVHVRRVLQPPLTNLPLDPRATILTFYDRSLKLQALVDRLLLPKEEQAPLQTELPLVVS